MGSVSVPVPGLAVGTAGSAISLRCRGLAALAPLQALQPFPFSSEDRAGAFCRERGKLALCFAWLFCD